MEPARIRIASARDPAEAMMIRSMLSAHDIHAVVSGEQHAGVFGGLAGPMISLDVWVDREDGERASDLIRELREGGGEPVPDDEPGEEPESVLDERDADLAVPSDDDDSPHVGIEMRKRTGVVLLLSCCVTFGTGHLYARAYRRWMGLAGVQIAGFLQMMGGNATLGALLVVGAIVTDLVGAIILVRRQARGVRLPRARLRS